MANPFLQAASLSHFSPTVFEPNVSTVDAKIHQSYLFMDKPLVTRSSTHARHLRQGKNGWLSLHLSQYRTYVGRYTTTPDSRLASDSTPAVPTTSKNFSVQESEIPLICYVSTIFFILSMHILWLHYAQHSPRLFCRLA